MTTASPATSTDLVPLADRIRYMQRFRLAAACVVLLTWVVLPDVRRATLLDLVMATASYLVITYASEFLWRRRQRRGLALFATMLIVDSLYLAWVSYVAEGPTTTLRYLIVVHIIAVALLASFRTGVRITLWHSMLLFLTFYGEEAGLLGTWNGQPVQLGDAEFRRHAAFVGVLWLVATATSSFAAVNERELRRRRYDLEALARLSVQLERAGDSGQVAHALIEAVAEDFDMERLLVIGFPNGEPEPTLLAFKGIRPTGVASLTPGPRSVVTRAIAGHRALLVAGISRDHDPWLSALLPDARNLVIVPLFGEGRALGVLIAEHAMRSGSRIERRVVSMLERFTSQAALALAGAWLLEQVQKMATMDGLTGVANRRSFDTTMTKEFSRASRNRDVVSVILVDIDHFNKLNDTLGHQAGDRVLRQVAGALARNSRATDTVARYGGEEFAVILPGLKQRDAKSVAEKLRKAVEQLETLVPVTCSLGVATYPVHANDTVALIQAADEALYASKEGGRNRSTVSERSLGVEPEPEAAAEPAQPGEDGVTAATPGRSFA